MAVADSKLMAWAGTVGGHREEADLTMPVARAFRTLVDTRLRHAMVRNPPSIPFRPHTPIVVDYACECSDVLVLGLYV